MIPKDHNSIGRLGAGRLLSITGNDGIELQGYLEDAGTNILLLHYHGLAGNFYENKFVHTFIAEAPKYKVSFLTVNSRAHDHFSDAHLHGRMSPIRRGATHTTMAEISSDLVSWLSFASQSGFDRIVIQGHSAGAVAVARLLLQKNAVYPHLIGAVFASPTDMVGLQVTTHGATGYRQLLTIAHNFVNSQQPQHLMPEHALSGYRFDASTYIDLFAAGGPADIFDYRCPKRLRILRKLGRPALFFFGGGDEVCSVPCVSALNSIKVQLGHGHPCICHLVPGAPHSYRGYEYAVTDLVLTWLTRLLHTSYGE